MTKKEKKKLLESINLVNLEKNSISKKQQNLIRGGDGCYAGAVCNKTRAEENATEK